MSQQTALAQAQKEWSNDMSTNYARGKVRFLLECCLSFRFVIHGRFTGRCLQRTSYFLWCIWHRITSILCPLPHTVFLSCDLRNCVHVFVCGLVVYLCAFWCARVCVCISTKMQSRDFICARFVGLFLCSVNFSFLSYSSRYQVEVFPCWRTWKVNLKRWVLSSQWKLFPL